MPPGRDRVRVRARSLGSWSAHPQNRGLVCGFQVKLIDPAKEEKGFLAGLWVAMDRNFQGPHGVAVAGLYLQVGLLPGPLQGRPPAGKLPPPPPNDNRLSQVRPGTVKLTDLVPTQRLGHPLSC